MNVQQLLIPILAYGVLGGCASVDQPAMALETAPRPAQAAERQPADPEQAEEGVTATPFGLPDSHSVDADHMFRGVLPSKVPSPLVIDSARRTGFLEDQSLDEVSGLAASRTMPGVLFALNDSGNAAEIHALSETGADLGHWRVNARNRDWEDMGNLQLDGKHYLVLGDTGDNRRTHPESTLYLVEEPALNTPSTTILEPSITLRFRYEDGPRNVEAFAFSGNTLYLISKEPIGPDGPAASRLYELQITATQGPEVLIARHTGSLPLAATSLESRLAAALAGVDLNHPTALDFDASGNTAYLLTYRHVLRIVRRENQTWANAFSGSSERIYSHALTQAEALAVVPGKSVWFTSENPGAPLWALPITAPS